MNEDEWRPQETTSIIFNKWKNGYSRKCNNGNSSKDCTFRSFQHNPSIDCPLWWHHLLNHISYVMIIPKILYLLFILLRGYKSFEEHQFVTIRLRIQQFEFNYIYLSSIFNGTLYWMLFIYEWTKIIVRTIWYVFGFWY